MSGLPVIRKSVDDSHVEGFAPRVSVYIEVFNPSSSDLDAVVFDELPLQARLVEADAAFRSHSSPRGLLLEARLRVPGGESRLLRYSMEFVQSFDGFLEPAYLYAGRLERRTNHVRLKVKVAQRALAAPAESLTGGERPPPGGVLEVLGFGLPRISFDDIPFHSQAKEGLRRAVDSMAWTLLRGRPGLWKARLVMAAANYAREKGYRVVSALDLAFAASRIEYDAPTVVTAPDLDQFIVYSTSAWPLLLTRLKEAPRDKVVVIASMSASWSELEERLGRGAGPAAVRALQELFHNKIDLQCPSFEEVKEYLKSSAGGYLEEEALTCEWLPAGEEITCDDVESIAKGLKMHFEKEGRRKLRSTDCGSVVTTVLAKKRSPAGRRGERA
jgi:hypothetical protein